jgi:hydroxyacylglutathione hydrolase
MHFERFEDPYLSHYSYAVGCPGAGEVAIVDPRRDVDVYLDFAARQGWRIRYVLETHIHADFASGARELAERAGATLALSAYDAGERYEVAFPHQPLADGEAIGLGKVRIQALHTPGHTPEHLAFLVFDLARNADVPMLLLSGDFLFVGSLGRPDLLGEEAKRGLAERMYWSVTEQLAGLPDGLEVHPAHGAGSMCGAGMSGRPMSTLGFERLANPYLDPKLGREAFVARLLADPPPFPDYYRRMKELNSAGPRILGELPGQAPIAVAEFHDRAAQAVVIDLRDQLAFGAGHVPGAFGIGAHGNLSQAASWVVPYERELLLVAADPADVEGAVRQLVRVGLDGVAGYLEGGMKAWVEAGYPLAEIPQLAATELAERLEGADPPFLVDVRSAGEFAGGHVAGARNILGGQLPERLDELPRDRPIALICRSGYRSNVAASVLQRAGFTEVANVAGGTLGWRRAGLPVSAS